MANTLKKPEILRGKDSFQMVFKNGKKIDPFMPIDAFGKYDDVEKRALFAYLMTLPPTPFGGR